MPARSNDSAPKTPGFLTRVFVGCARGIFNAAFRVARLQKPRREVIFVSRKMNEPSYNFREVAREFREAGYEVVFLTKYLSARSVFSYTAHVFREIWHLGRAEVCVLDRYDPVVSLLDFPCETLDGGEMGADAAASFRPIHREVPLRPVIIQLWHAFGAYKKFGYQSVGTIEGHSLATAKLFGIHRNYSWIVCTGESSRVPFAEAFSYPVERVVACGLPEQKKLERFAAERAGSSANECIARSKRERDEHAEHAQRPLRVLFAPTLRKSSESAHPFHELKDTFAQMNFDTDKLEMHWQFHPIEQKGTAAQDVPEQLLWADVVVTDYSSIIYEAYLLGKIVLFYVPDIDEYRRSPGLNADPMKRCPEICFDDPERVSDMLLRLSEEKSEGSLAPSKDCHSRLLQSAMEPMHRSLRTFVDDVFDAEYEGVLRLIHSKYVS